MGRWIRMKANRGQGAYEHSISDNPSLQILNRSFPSYRSRLLMKLGFLKTGRYVTGIRTPGHQSVARVEMFEALPFKHIVAVDFEFEFGGRDGERPRPVCMVAKELRSGQEWRMWRGRIRIKAAVSYRARYSVHRLLRHRGARMFPRSGLANAGAHHRSVRRIPQPCERRSGDSGA